MSRSPQAAEGNSRANNIRPGTPSWLLLLVSPALLWLLGCHSLNLLSKDRSEPGSDAKADAVVRARGGPTLPSKYSFRIAPYVFQSDFEIVRTQPLFTELAQLRDQVYKELLLPPGTAQVQVYLFENRERYERFMQFTYPDLPPRRAFFVAQPRTIGGAEDLLVYTYWGDRIRQDLRHELTHALLHSVIKEVPLWLDEGLAEYFELPPDRHGINSAHVDHLRRSLAGTYRPDLARLEGLKQVDEMNPAEYREAWAWVYLMLRTKPEAKTVLLSYLQQLRGMRHPGPIRPQLVKAFRELEAQPDKGVEDVLAAHLAALPVPMPATAAREPARDGPKTAARGVSAPLPVTTWERP